MKKRIFLSTILSVLIFFIVSSLYAKTAYEFLNEAKTPEFKKGHTLPPLTRFGWELGDDAIVELAKNWGYALEMSEENAVTFTNTQDHRVASIAKKEHLPIFVKGPRPLFSLGIGFLNDIAEEKAFMRDENGNVIRVLSPEADDIVYEKTAEVFIDVLNNVADVAGKENIKIILNAGEYGIRVYGWDKKNWEKDPKVLTTKGEKDWFQYISERKAAQESVIKKAVNKNFPGALYIYYHTEAVHRNRTPDWWRWSFDYKHIRNVSDLPSSSIYYTEFNSGFDPNGKDGDMLTQALNSVAQQLQFGDNLSYNWVCAGYEHPLRQFADLSTYMGYLKCYYTAGMIGGIAGYFSFPKKGGFKWDQGEEIPHWLGQMMVLSYVHALFSHYEDFLRDGSLLPGLNKHKWSTDLPAYEFPTGDPYFRVLARKHNKKKEWLITGWSMDGKERKAVVEIPERGKMEIVGRGCGSVYKASIKRKKAVLTQVDKDVIYPPINKQPITNN